ncbi:uncharacterized protein LOC135426365 [Drosophila montana]|uniref:uncharacterized protein LOC135426365 n=1 Tax=Drosophila montana TaxID=40370 RepID=UPI00313D31E8
MVAYYDDSDGVEQPKTLTYWVRNFRMKRLQMRRKLRGAGSLRVNAILSTALFHAEHELRRKQQERFSRWLDVQTKLIPHGNTHESNFDEKFHHACDVNVEKETAEFERRNIENSLWRSELSGLDRFLNSLSSSSSKNNNNISKCAIAVSS